MISETKYAVTFTGDMTMQPDDNSTRPEVSAVVPSYQHAAYVERCLDSIFRQTLCPKKLLVIDDGSTDGSPRIIESALKRCPFDAELIVRENRGLCRTLNEAFALTGGKYFAYISSDDVWLPRFLESRTAILDQRPDAVISYGHAYLIDDDDMIIDSTRHWGEYTDGNATEMLLGPRIPTSASVVYVRQALARFGWNEDSILEDYELYLKLSRLGEFALDKNILSAWRIHGSNTSGDFPLMMNEWLEAQDRNAAELGISAEELRSAQKKLRFNCIASQIRNGQRREAFRSLLANSAGQPALLIGGLALRLLVPDMIIKWRRKLARARNKMKYGRLEY